MYCRWPFLPDIVTIYLTHSKSKIGWKFWKPYIKLLQYQDEMPPAIPHNLLLVKKNSLILYSWILLIDTQISLNTLYL